MSDPLSGFFGIQREAFDTVADAMHPQGFKVLLELYYRLSLRRPHGVRCLELPYRFRTRLAGQSKLSSRIVWQYLRMLVGLRREQPWPRRLLRFLCVGALGVVVNCGLLALLERAAGWHYLLASPAAIELSIVHNFAWHDNWTFRDRRGDSQWATRLWQYHVAAAAGMLINWAVLGLLVGIGRLPLLPSNVVGIAAGTVVNFTISKLWTWKTESNALTG